MFGSGAVLLARPHKPGIETVNDLSGLVCNFWRAVKHDPDQVAYYADYPAIENDLHARHYWLVQQKESLQARLEGDPDYYDAKIAGWWCWGISLWLGTEFPYDKGPWRAINGLLVRSKDRDNKGIKRAILHLTSYGRGIFALQNRTQIKSLFTRISNRLAHVRVACGNWERVCTPVSTYRNGLTGIFMDPPYGYSSTRDVVYEADSFEVANECHVWCIENGNNPLMRIALCGYSGEHEELLEYGWTYYIWNTQGGYGNRGNGQGSKNAKREIIWFSPHCLKDEQMALFGDES